MKSKGLRCGKGQISEKGVEEDEATQFMLGDLLWVKLNSGSWWPAQLVDENAVSGSIKPSNKSAGESLVRLYGSYKYLYVDPAKCHSEFELILEQNSGCCQKIFKKALKQNCPRSKYGRSKRQAPKLNETIRIDASRDESDQDRVKDQDVEASNFLLVSRRQYLPKFTPKMKEKNGHSKKAEEARNEALKKDGIKQNHKPNSSSSAVEAAENRTSRRDRRLRMELKKWSNGEEKNSKQKMMLKKLKLDGPSIELTSRRAKEEARTKISLQARACKSLKRRRSSTEKQPDKKAYEVDLMQKKPQQHSRSAEKDRSFQSPMRHGMCSEHKKNGPSGEQEAKDKSYKPSGLQKKLKPNPVGNELTSQRAKEEARIKISLQARPCKSLKRKSSCTEKELDKKACEVMCSEHMKSGPSDEQEAKEKSYKPSGLQKKLRPNPVSIELTSRRAKEEARIKISLQARACKSLKRKSSCTENQLDKKACEVDVMQKKPKQRSKSAEKDRNYQSPLRNVMCSKHKKNGPSDEQEAKEKSYKQSGLQKKLKPNISIAEEEAKSKSFCQVEVQNNLKPQLSGTVKGKKFIIPDQYVVQKKAKPNDKSTGEDAKIKSRGQDDVLEQNKLKSPSCETIRFGKSQELSARRMKVMQSLGLIAPSGS